MTNRKILFISHDASRTGAPIILLHFLKWLRANTDIPFRILLRNGGVLEYEFRALAPVTVLNNGTSSFTRLAEKATYFPSLRRAARLSYLSSLKKRLLRDDIALIYSNTITNSQVFEFLPTLECPMITHVHELDHAIRYNTGLANFRRVQERTRSYIAVSEAVKRNLIENHGISQERIEKVYGFISIHQCTSSSQREVRKRIRKELGIPREDLIVGASGTTDWRKGPDLFIQLARSVHQRALPTPVHFLWVGGESDGPRFGALWHDVKNVGLEKYIHFLGVRPNSLDYFAAFDVFALVSREDPFPLVILEAASLGKPIVCFDGSGGAKEFVENDCGFVLPYLDIQGMADKVVAILQRGELRQHLGSRAAQKVRARHNIESNAPKVLNIIRRFL